MRIAIFGGSFDPVHLGHKKIVETALQYLDIDKLIIVPAYLNPFKDSSYLEAQFRYELVKKLFSAYNKVEVSSYEIDKKTLSYTYETVKHFKSLYSPKKLYFILGEDNLQNLDKWYKIEELKKDLEFIVVTREGTNNKDLSKFKTLNLKIDISSSKIRENFDLKFIPKEIREALLNLKKGENLSSRVENIKAILEDKKAVDVEVFDLTNKDYMVDYVVIASTLNPKHTFSLIDYLKIDLKPKGEEFLRIDEDENWTVIDLGDIFIHLMSEKYREKYNLEDFLKEFQQARL